MSQMVSTAPWVNPALALICFLLAIYSFKFASKLGPCKCGAGQGLSSGCDEVTVDARLVGRGDKHGSIKMANSQQRDIDESDLIHLSVEFSLRSNPGILEPPAPRQKQRSGLSPWQHFSQGNLSRFTRYDLYMRVYTKRWVVFKRLGDAL